MLYSTEREAVDGLPLFLSCFLEKRRIYAQDHDFLAAWTELQTVESFPRASLWQTGSVMFKADSILRRNVGRGLDWLATNGYQVIAARPVSFDRSKTLGLWRDALGRFSPERADLLARLQALCPSLYLLVQAPFSQQGVPATLELTDRKGQARLDQRQSGTLRDAMGEPRSAFFNFVHTADEPADLIRELGLLFTPVERHHLFHEMHTAALADARSICLDLYANSPEADLEPQSALARVNAAWIALDDKADTTSDRLQLDSLTYSAWRSLLMRLRERGIAVEEIDDIVISGALLPLKRPNPTEPFPSCEPRHWASHVCMPPGREACK